MKHATEPARRVAWLRVVPAMILAVSALVPPETLAQVPARFYWRTLDGSNGVPLIVNSMSGNTNPFDPAQPVLPGSNVDGTVAGRSFNQSTAGFGDPMLEFSINVLGPPAQKNLPDVLRYQPGFSVNVLADLALPMGQYDSSKALNLGQNRWYGRIGMPVVWQLGDWVPGRRTTLEFLPAMWLLGDNDDFVRQKLKTDPLFQLDAHLTRDFTEHFWGSLDASFYGGARKTINGVEGNKRSYQLFGLTLGYQVNENLNLTFGYKSTVNDSGPNDLRMTNSC